MIYTQQNKMKQKLYFRVIKIQLIKTSNEIVVNLINV